jgi:alkylation response protein AidB-like acyl-CoA dehydrogenase
MEKPEQIDVQNLLINIRSIQSFGAMEKILKLCIEYCSQRKQFGRT